MEKRSSMIITKGHNAYKPWPRTIQVGLTDITGSRLAPAD